MKKNGPLRVALAEVASGVWPSAVDELDQLPSLIGAGDPERRLGADGVAGTLYAFPENLIWADGLDSPPKGRSIIGEIEPDNAARKRHLTAVPGLKIGRVANGFADAVRLRAHLDLVMNFRHRPAPVLYVHPKGRSAIACPKQSGKDFFNGKAGWIIAMKPLSRKAGRGNLIPFSHSAIEYKRLPGDQDRG